MRTASLPDRTRQRCLGIPAVVAVLLIGRLDALAAAPNLDWIDREALAAGEVLVDTERSARPQTVRVRVATLVAAPPQSIWSVLRACEIAPEYVPNVVSCRSLEIVDEGRGELFLQVVKPAFFAPAFEHVFRLDYFPYERIEVHRVSGPIAFMEGSWWLLPQDDDRILLFYELEVDPGIPVPRFFVRATMRRDLPRLVRAVRERAEMQH